jgi:hypothetical protein
MARPLDPKSKTAQIVIKPTNDEEEQLFRDFKRVLAKDAITVRQFFLEQIQHKVKLDNPQLHFTQDGSLNKKPNVKPKYREVQCDCGGRVNCARCAGQGTYYEEAT